MQSLEGARLDPQNWGKFRGEISELLADCMGRLEHARDYPWQPPATDLAGIVSLRNATEGQGANAVFDTMRRHIMPYATGNTHPGFFGWVHGTGSAIGVAAEMVAATMNSNCGGRNHGATDVEIAVINWVCNLAGMPDKAFGVMTGGTSQATLLALNAARFRLFGNQVRREGIQGLPPVAIYAAAGAHSCVGQALEVMGHGRMALREIKIRDGAGMEGAGMDVAALRAAVERDIAAGVTPLAVVATAGSVNTGTFDPIGEIADFCAAQGIWMHVDAAFGFWTLLAEDPWCQLAANIGRAQSIALDFHKWMGAPYAAGACLINEGAVLRATFADRPEYLTSGSDGLASGDVWFTDYGLDLSRGFSALKVWAIVKAAGTKALGASITDNCKQARLMGELVDASPVLTLAHPVISNICCFVPIGGDARDIAAQLQLAGDVVFSTTTINGQVCLRAAIVNHRTTQEDIIAALQSVEVYLEL